MTMVANTINNGFPILIGDILTSTEDRPAVFDTPTLAENLMVYLSADKEYYPYGHAQKIYTITNNFCFGFAGRNYLAKIFLDDLKIKFGNNPWVTIDELMAYLNGRGIRDIVGEVDFIIVLIEKRDGQFAAISIPFGNVLNEQFTVFDDLNVIGSGAQSFIDGVKRLDKTYTPAPITAGEAIATNMGLIGSILARERLDLHTFAEDWGAGFETVFFDGERFVRYDNGCFVYLHAEVDEHGYKNFPAAFKVTHYRYIDELLIITDIEAAKGYTQEIGDRINYRYEVIKRRSFIVPPIDFVGDIDVEKYTMDLSFSSRRVTFSYIIEGKGRYFPATFHDKDVEVDFVDGTSLAIKMPREPIDKIQEIVLAKQK